MDEHSYIALICLSCGPSKEDIKNQSELLKERFVDYLESKQAAGICNVGNEVEFLNNFDGFYLFSFITVGQCFSLFI